MNFLKRVLTSIIRIPVKSFILFLLIFVLGSALSGALSVRNAIHVTDLSLRQNMRPVIALAEIWDYLDDEARDEAYNNFPRSNLFDDLYAIGELPYVDYFDSRVLSHLGGIVLTSLFSFGITTVLISTLIPITYLMRLNPKGILVKGSIG